MRGPRSSGTAVRPSGAAARFERTLLLCTRGVKARHRHLLHDLLQLLPHGKLGSKLPTEDGLSGVLELCENGGCGSSLLLDARDPRRLFLWAANCPDGPSAMFQVVNTHTVAELQFDARRVSGARNVLVFDPAFNESAEMRVLKALLTNAFAVPSDAAATTSGAPLPARHSVSFAANPKPNPDPDPNPNPNPNPNSNPNPNPNPNQVSFAWLDGRVWMRVYAGIATSS